MLGLGELWGLVFLLVWLLLGFGVFCDGMVSFVVMQLLWSKNST